jgi:hypothetical protein
VPTHDIVPYRDPLDLLRRFAPAPLKVSLHFEFANVALETNDLSFFPSASANASPSSAAYDPALPSCLWKLLRDVDVRDKLTEASIVMAGSLIIYSTGPACIIAADRERQEVLAFIGVEADTRVFHDVIFPALCRLTEFVTRPLPHANASAAQLLPVGDACNV